MEEGFIYTPSPIRNVSRLLSDPSNTLEQFEGILDKHAPLMSSRDVAIALCLLPKVEERQRRRDAGPEASGWSRSVAGRRQEDSVGADELASRAYRVKLLSLASVLSQSFLVHLPTYGPRDLSGSVWALGRVGVRASGGWTTSVLGASLGRLDEFDAGQLSRLLWGVAALRVDPGREWMDEAISRAMALVRGGQATSQHLVLLLWSTLAIADKTASCGPRLNSDVKTTAELSRGGPRTGSIKEDQGRDIRLGPPESLFSTSRGAPCDVADVNGFAAWVEECLLEVKPHVERLEPQYISMLLSALAKARHRPDGFTMEALTSACMLHFHHRLPIGDLPEASDDRARGAGSVKAFGPQGLSNILWALARLNYRPPAAWWELCMAESEAMLQVMNGQELALTIWAMVLLQVGREVVRLADAAGLLLHDQASRGS